MFNTLRHNLSRLFASEHPGLELDREAMWESLFLGVPVGAVADGFCLGNVLAKSTCRLGALEDKIKEMRALQLDLPPVSLVSVTGSSAKEYSATIWAGSSSKDSRYTRPLVDKVPFFVDNQTLTVRNPTTSSALGFIYYMDVIAPCDWPVSIVTASGAVDLKDIAGRIYVRSANGRLSVINNSTGADLGVTGGSIAWTGRGGTHRFVADLGIDLKCEHVHFPGYLEARCDGLIRMNVPRGFSPSIQVSVQSAGHLCIRGDASTEAKSDPQVQRRSLVSIGKGAPTIQLTSTNGKVEVDFTASE